MLKWNDVLDYARRGNPLPDRLSWSFKFAPNGIHHYDE